ncbi:MAG: tRNA (adenosine(37)-N6)-threonylcarbamoyltransferase complex ATPase subunit type 1 TsaE [Opitutales bacterium]|nr:tRNA (adenosine(37)-N6)-threonylcarbamoyltransferase complex ATPase subunit type 1 TsaE [Opitutales bacterium]
MNIFDRLKKGVDTRCAAETVALAEALAKALPEDSVIALHGDLGCGKTTFVAGMAKAWGIDAPVTSPSYNLFTIYRGKTRMLAHLDAYRLRSAEDMDALMIEEFLKSPWCMAVEWPEKVEQWLPQNALHLHLEDMGKALRHIRLA